MTDPTATSPTDSFTNTDYNAIDDGSIQQMTTPASMNSVTAASGTYGKWGAISFADDFPDRSGAARLRQRQPNGSKTDPTYFYEATDAQDIGTQLNVMLETALGSSIRVTN